MSLPRSYLYVPGTNEQRIQKALASAADAVIIDLEDAVPLAEKDRARYAATAAVAAVRRPGQELWVRVNSGDLLELDVCSVAREGDLTGFCLPKASGAQTRDLIDLLEDLNGDWLIEPLVETAAGLVNVTQLVRQQRVRRLHLGEVDLSAELGVSPVADGQELLWARSMLVAHSAAGGLAAPVGPVSTEFRDPMALQASSESLKRLGFWGRACIHPAQVHVVNAIFTRSPDEIAWAQNVLEQLALAAERGDGVAVDPDGRLIDEASARIARRVLASGSGSSEAHPTHVQPAS